MSAVTACVCQCLQAYNIAKLSTGLSNASCVSQMYYANKSHHAIDFILGPGGVQCTMLYIWKHADLSDIFSMDV